MPGVNLTRFEAEGRSRVIKNPKYSIYLDFMDEGDFFESITTIEFDAVFGTSTFVDLVAKEVYAITLNNQTLDPKSAFNDSRIAIEDLLEHNRLTIRALCKYSNQGEGLHKFIDPIDNQRYLYSQFEVPDSRKVFAVFEQPDIKGTFAFTVVAPSHWEISSTQPTLPPKQAPFAGENASIWSFTPTPKISSYVTSICAGPYAVFSNELTNTDGRTIPLRLMCKQSLAEHFDVETIFDITKKGFDFYGKTFDFPYPYSKYDQLFVPEFNAGAMENVGNITYTDAYIFRSKTAKPVYERRCVTILHELAHMWFGDLVTMKWWNDLWLNESFAEFMSGLATAEATEYTDGWVTFATAEKAWAFTQDDLPSTHPIWADIRDLFDVQVNFDGITYAKGASVLKQLVAYVGRENFFSAITAYLRKHSFGNATLTDLTSELEAASHRDLDSWVISWLQSAGVNTVAPRLQCTGSIVTKFQIEQTAPENHPTLRPHLIGVGFYNFDKSKKLVRTDYHEIDIDGNLTTLALKDFELPDLLLLNDEDLTYAKVALDPKSLKTALKSVEAIDDALARATVLNSLYNMMTDCKLKPSKYLELILRVLKSEENSAIVKTLLMAVYEVCDQYIQPKNRIQAFTDSADAIFAIAKACKDENSKLQYIQSFCQLASSPAQAKLAQAILDGSNSELGIELDWELKWNLLSALVNCKAAGIKEIEAMVKLDESQFGRQNAAKLAAQIPTKENKAYIFDSLFDRDDKSNAIVRFTTVGFQAARDESVFDGIGEKYFGKIVQIFKERDFQNAETLMGNMFPSHLANAKFAEFGRNWLAENKTEPYAILRTVEEHVYLLEEALKLRKFDAS